MRGKFRGYSEFIEVIFYIILLFFVFIPTAELCLRRITCVSTTLRVVLDVVIPIVVIFAIFFRIARTKYYICKRRKKAMLLLEKNAYSFLSYKKVSITDKLFEEIKNIPEKERVKIIKALQTFGTQKTCFDKTTACNILPYITLNYVKGTGNAITITSHDDEKTIQNKILDEETNRLCFVYNIKEKETLRNLLEKYIMKEV